MAVCLLVTLLLTALALSAPRGAAADQYHYGNALIGDRASGMGAAYTAISDDTTGLYYNPAGIVYAAGRNVSASVNAYYNSVKSYKGAIGGKDWDRKSSALLPNYFGVIQPVGGVKVGFSYAVPDSIQEDQDQVFINPTSSVARYVIDFNNEDNTYNFGPTVAMEINKQVSVGVTLYLHHRRNQFILNQLVNMNDGTNEWTNQYFETNEDGIRPLLGVMFSPREKVSVGLAISKTMLYKSTTTGQIMCSDNTPGGCDNNTATNDPFYPNITDTGYPYEFPVMTHAKRKYPTQVALGAAYFPSDSLLLSADVKYFTAVTDPTYGDRKAVVNYALGAEYFLSNSVALRGGLFTDMANTPTIAAGGMNQLEHVDLYGLSASVSNFTKNTSVTLGGNITKGDGKAQIIGGSTDIQDVEIIGWTVFLSSSYSY